MILAAVFGSLRGTASISEIGMIAVMILPVLIVIQAIMLPFQLKFGGEKGRIALIGALGLLFVIGIAVVKAAGIDILDIIYHLPAVSMGVMIAALIAAAAILFLVSMKISIAIMKNKEF